MCKRDQTSLIFFALPVSNSQIAGFCRRYIHNMNCHGFKPWQRNIFLDIIVLLLDLCSFFLLMLITIFINLLYLVTNQCRMLTKHPECSNWVSSAPKSIATINVQFIFCHFFIFFPTLCRLANELWFKIDLWIFF